MAEYSEPKFLSFKQMEEINKSKIKTTAICQCPLPCAMEINGVVGGYCHVVEYEKKYICKKCGTEFSCGKHFR